jgi:hypothetical protein
MHDDKLGDGGGNGNLKKPLTAAPGPDQLVATFGRGLLDGVGGIGGAGGMSPDEERDGGSGGQGGTCATRSRQVWRSSGDICDQRSAFFKNSARSVGLMPANFA